MEIIFFGSFLEYSVTVLRQLVTSDQIKVVGVVTTPPRPAGRDKKLNKTHVHQFAEQNNLPVFTPENLNQESLNQLQAEFDLKNKPDFIISAGYGKLVPKTWLKFPSRAAINLHLSLLPQYRGANPAEWALLFDETETGITVIEMGLEFDTGKVVAQSKIPIAKQDTRVTLYKKLYELGAKVLPDVLTKYQELDFKQTFEASTTDHDKNNSQQQLKVKDVEYTLWTPPINQAQSDNYHYAHRLNRDDGFLPWEAILQALNGQKITNNEGFSPLFKDFFTLSPEFIERMIRALAGFPGVWTNIPTSKGQRRMKVLSSKIKNNKLILDRVQIAGQEPALWNQVKNSIKS